MYDYIDKMIIYYEKKTERDMRLRLYLRLLKMKNDKIKLVMVVNAVQCTTTH